MTPNARRWLTIALAALATVALGVGGLILFWPNPSAPQTGAGIGQMTAGGSLTVTVPSTGVQPYVAASPVDYQTQDAVQAHRAYPEYYQCRAYPSDANLKQADLVPTANVVVTITYDKHSNKYVVSGDPRITVHETDSTEPANSDVDHPFQMQELSFSFADGVHYFGAFSQYKSMEGMRWGAATLYGTEHAVPDYYLPVSPGNGQSDPVYVIVATDTRTCHAGKVSVPAEFSWKQLADNGLLLPEFYGIGGSGIHPQG